METRLRLAGIALVILLVGVAFMTPAVQREREVAVSAIGPIPIKPRRRFLASNASKLLIFNSFPGSGNTWVRHLIEVGTRVFTGSVYNETSIQWFFKGENVSDSTVIVVKDHHPCDECNLLAPKVRTTEFLNAVCPFCAQIQYDSGVFNASKAPAMRVDQGRIVLLMRNPFDTLLAEFHRRFSAMNHTGTAPLEDLFGAKFERFFKGYVRRWVMRNEKYSRLVLYTLYYEHLVRDTFDELVRFFGFLKRHRPDDLHDLHPVAAAARAMADERGQARFKRKRATQLDVYAIPRPRLGNSTLRQFGCKSLRHVWREDIWGPCE